MSLRLTQTDGSSMLTAPRQRVRKAVAALFAGALLAGGAAAVVPAQAHAVDPGVCQMGIRLAQGYWDRGDIRTGNDIIYNLVRMGCADGGAAPAAPTLAE
jgi:hypothetical protein